MDKVKSSIKNSKKEGRCQSGCAPYGYKRDMGNRGHLIIDEVAAKVVKQIFQMVIEGYGVYGICSRLTKEGVPNPSQYRSTCSKANRKEERVNFLKSVDGIWAVSTIRRILHNQVYLGHMVQYHLEKTHASNIDSDLFSIQKVIKKHTHEPIVGEDIFCQVQNLLNSKGRVRGHILSGKVYCKDCNSVMHKSSTRNKKGVNYQYLRCSLASKTRGEECTPHRISYDALLSYLEDRIWEKISLGADDKIVEGWKEADETERKQVEEYRILLQDKVKELKKGFVTLYLDRVKGILSEEQFYSMKKSIEREKYGLDKELCRLKKRESEEGKNVQRINKIQLSRGMLCRFVDYIEIGEKQGNHREIIIHWKEAE